MQAGQRVGPFEIEKQLGSGAMGAVYRAKYRKTGKRVAIKVMLAGMGGNETALARFEREWEVLKQLKHRNIVQFYIAHQFQGAPYYAMEYIEGEPLDQVLRRRGRLTWEEMVDIGKQICAALQHAHDQGIVHRDLKPSNLMMTPDGTLKLTDFGIAKDLDVTQLTAANCTVGTAAYMSPEQCRGERNLSHKSDLYSLGIVLYELLTGQKPFKCETTMDMFLAHVQGTFERPSRVVLDIPVWLDTLVCQLLEKDPAQRPFDAAMVAQALDKVAEKVTAQRSAGIDAAQARVADRSTARSASLDETDKQAARTLLASARKGKRKRKGKPFYEQGWFQGLGILALLLGIAVILYQAFKPPSADALYQEAKRRMESAAREDRDAARKGAIENYLYYYSDRDDEQARQIHQWADQYDVEQTWLGLLRQHKNGLRVDPEITGQQAARAAIEREEAGLLDQAVENWQTLLRYKPEKDRELHKLGLLAEKRVAALHGAEENEQSLRRRIDEARNTGQEIQPQGEAERLASEAMRFEDLGDLAMARTRWGELKPKFAQDLAQGAWGLLAAKKAAELKGKVRAEMEETPYRVKEVLKKTLARAEKLTKGQSAQGQGFYRDILTLYGKEAEPEIAEQVAIARKRLEELTLGAAGDNPPK
jgi:serine/threonine-protein kinase